MLNPFNRVLCLAVVHREAEIASRKYPALYSTIREHADYSLRHSAPFGLTMNHEGGILGFCSTSAERLYYPLHGAMYFPIPWRTGNETAVDVLDSLYALSHDVGALYRRMKKPLQPTRCCSLQVYESSNRAELRAMVSRYFPLTVREFTKDK